MLFEGQSGNFPCKDLKKSETKPKSVHKLKPGDIDVVAAIGDSITAGMGSLGKNIFQVNNEYRGVSFSIGNNKVVGNKKLELLENRGPTRRSLFYSQCN